MKTINRTSNPDVFIVEGKLMTLKRAGELRFVLEPYKYENDAKGEKA